MAVDELSFVLLGIRLETFSEVLETDVLPYVVAKIGLKHLVLTLEAPYLFVF